jgi:uncharacterized membrane protein YbhN (UPF0104 family)
LNPAIRKYGPTLLKIALSLACLWYAMTKPDWGKIAQSWRRVDLGWTAIALGAYTLSKVLASNRLNINFRLIGLSLSEKANLRLFWLGMLYNLLLPGAVTGDAYKVMVLGKHPGIGRKSLALAVLLDRFSGLLSLTLIIAGLSLYVFPASSTTTLIAICAFLAPPVCYWGILRFMPNQATGFLKTFWMGAGVQLLVVITVTTLMWALGLSNDLTGYLLVFLAAAALSVLPISIGGGLGIREFASIQGAQWLGLPIEDALLLSLLFYGVTVATALPGLLFIFRDPLQE